MIFLLLSLPIIISALTYNDPCQNRCDLPGLVCENNRCQCDSKQRLFWTGSRCFSCPNSWTRSETACIVYYHTKTTWNTARLTCQSVKAELISFRRPDIVQLLYTLQYRVDRKKRAVNYADATVGWTSARVENFQNAIYKWLDPSMLVFNNQSSWWCRNTTNLGYVYRYNEPTRWTTNGESEACVVYWRGKKDTPVVCLDDQLCSKEFEFVCELSESTAKQYHGPPPTVSVQGTTRTPTIVIVRTTSTHKSFIIQPSLNNPNPNSNAKPIVSVATEPKTNLNIIIIIVAIVAAVLVLLALILGLYCCLKRRRTNFNIRNSKATMPVSQISDASSIAPSIVPEPVQRPEPMKTPEPVKIPLPVTPNLNIQKPKNQRSAFTKQQFDEFD